EGDVGALHIAEITHPAAKGPEDVHPRGRGERRQQADERLTCRVLLCARRERPGGSRAAKRGYQFPPSDVDWHEPLPCEGWLVKATISRRKRAVLRSKIAGSDRSVRRCGLVNSAGIDDSMAVCTRMNLRRAEPDVIDFLRATLAGRAHPVTKVEASARAAVSMKDSASHTQRHSNEPRERLA